MSLERSRKALQRLTGRGPTQEWETWPELVLYNHTFKAIGRVRLEKQK